MLVKDGEIFLARKNKKCKHGCEQYKNLPENEKQKLVEYQKNYFKVWTNKDQLKFLAIQDFFWINI